MASPGHQVIVVGAGLSGLSAAKWLRQSGVDCLVLEARDRVGGRTLTRKDPAVGYIDLGGAYVGPTQDHLIRMAKELGVETYIVNEVEDLVYYSHGSRSRWRGGGLPPFWNPLAAMDVNNFFRTLDQMTEEIPFDAPWDAPHADEWDTTTFKEFMQKTLHTQTGRKLARIFISIDVTTEPYEASLLWFLWYVKLCGGTRRIISTTNGGQERKFKGGSQQISEKIADILGDSVLLEKAVVAVSEKDKIVTVQTLDGSEYTAHHVILALPPMLQMKVHFQPPLPPLRNQLIQRMPMGTCIKLNLYYRTAFWREKGMCGSMIIDGDDDHPVILTLDDTKPDGSHPSIIGFITGDKCRKIVSKSKEERRDIVAKSFAKVLDCKEALQPVHYEEYIWMSEQYSGGCYTNFCPPGLLTRYGRVLRRPIGRLYFAGTETAVWWSGYMEGAISAGERAAREVLYDMGKLGRDQIWRVEPRSTEIFGEDVPLTCFERYCPSVPGFFRMVRVTLLLGVISAALIRCNKFPFLRK